MKAAQEKKEYLKDYYQKNKERLKARASIAYYNNREDGLRRSKEQKARDPEGYKEYLRTYRLKNRAKLSEQSRIRFAAQPRYRVKNIIANAIRKRLNGKIKTSKSEVYIGCSFSELIDWLTSKFSADMSWENYGTYWHIDHIIPCRAFDLMQDEELKRCFHYTNLQPLPKAENCSKQDKLPNGKLARNEITYKTS